MAHEAPWIMCQLGAREHYVLPAGLHQMGRLRALFTDSWVKPDSALARLPGRGSRLSERYNPALRDARVEHFTMQALCREFSGSLKNPANDWEPIIARNGWFQSRVSGRLKRSRLLETEQKPIVFAYSYAALEILKTARAAGCKTVLGQIDPAIAEEGIVAEAVARRPDLASNWHRPPTEYWHRWREECELADHIVVNSDWSRRALIEVGIDAAKIAIIPLAYDVISQPHQRSFPPAFTQDRPLRLLFLGSVIIRKGGAELLEAARFMADKPVRFELVGGGDPALLEEAGTIPSVTVHGPVSRASVHEHYQAADAFILPTLSDGFALTQIEAHAQGLPVIASRRCGDVVRDGVDGLLLETPSSEEIVGAVDRYLADPAMLARHSLAAVGGLERFTPARIARQLSDIVEGSAV